VPEGPNERILYRNPIRHIWRISYLIQCFADPFYADIEREHGLSRLEVVTLHCLAQCGELRAQQIVEMLVRPKNTVSGAVHSLLVKRLIIRRRDRADARMAILALAAKGRVIYEKLLPRLQAREQDLMAPLTTAEREQFEACLEKLIAAVPDWRFASGMAQSQAAAGRNQQDGGNI
jgi:DNA-binding MarR family transcriptional regulator